MSKLEVVARQALEALEAQHNDRTAYSRAKRAANATCGEFKNNTLSELVESGYMYGMGKQTEYAITALREALAEQQAAEPVACKGIPRKGCNYLAPCDTVCNKCGQVHYHHQMVAIASAPTQQPLTDEQCDAIYTALDEWSREVDAHEFGLPAIAGGGMEKGREIIRAAHGIIPQKFPPTNLER